MKTGENRCIFHPGFNLYKSCTGRKRSQAQREAWGGERGREGERIERQRKLHSLPVVLHCFVFKYFFHHKESALLDRASQDSLASFRETSIYRDGFRSSKSDRGKLTSFKDTLTEGNYVNFSSTKAV
jgi:hypothetical protein